MDSREIVFIAVLLAAMGIVVLRAFMGQPSGGMSRLEWQRKVLARVLAVIALAIGVAVTLSRQH